jgi:hypothetical protein
MRVLNGMSKQKLLFKSSSKLRSLYVRTLSSFFFLSSSSFCCRFRYFLSAPNWQGRRRRKTEGRSSSSSSSKRRVLEKCPLEWESEMRGPTPKKKMAADRKRDKTVKNGSSENGTIPSQESGWVVVWSPHLVISASLLGLAKATWPITLENQLLTRIPPLMSAAISGRMGGTDRRGKWAEIESGKSRLPD